MSQSGHNEQTLAEGRDAATGGQPQRLAVHVEELVSVLSCRGDSFIQHSRSSLFYAFFHYVAGNTLAFLTTLVVAPASILFDPLSTIATLISYPGIYTILFVAIFGLYLASSMGGSALINYISRKYADGYSAVNWASPALINSAQSANTIRSARATLGGLKTTFPDAVAPGALPSSPPKTNRIFDLDVAKACLSMCALVYERDDKLVEKAVAKAARGDVQGAEVLLLDSETTIREQAAKWDLNYEGISDLSSTSGPFASAFYTQSGEEKPFIVLVFKGTTPSNYAEFLTNATITRINATSWFGDGTVHEGFATSLFPMFDERTDGFGQILFQLKHIAETLSPDPESSPVPLFVTGHSLGSALASLLYTRLLRVPCDLGKGIVLRDCYLYGTPRLGDAQFAAKFEESTITPINRPNIMWRVKNNRDIVTRIPAGFAHPQAAGMVGTSTSVLNYAHIGVEIYLRPHKAPYYEADTTQLHHATRVVIVKDGSQHPPMSSRLVAYNSSYTNALRWALCFLLPDFAWDHLPASYAQVSRTEARLTETCQILGFLITFTGTLSQHLDQITATGVGGSARGKRQEALTVGAAARPNAAGPLASSSRG
ncbi:BQ5605_C005g03613 [Microbotryum silenes-dioicae]|uniref:BQ5605_C005g03613 protein n=1 Tax=Microbotryum silenes-dioicae TaxID=796604 RepID=A0A2X0P6Y6_9BASI|nr:BQ5605_C005g03613 [Microbotryum silenes-dioicae]